MTDAAQRAEQNASEKEERAENLKPELLRTYAAIFEKPQRDPVSGTLMPPSELCIAAARALRFQADALERGAEY